MFHGRYYEQAKNGGVFYLSVAAGAATAYAGAAAGTPLLAIHNPASSGKNLAILFASVSIDVAASAAGTVSFSIWGGPSVIPTGTATAPTNMLSQAATGAVAKGFANAALTGSTALALIQPLGTYYWATAASALLAPIQVDIGGLIIVAPGNQVAIGGTAALTSATYSATLMWDEVDI